MVHFIKNTISFKKIIFFIIIAAVSACSPYSVTKISALIPGNAPIPTDVKKISLALIQNEFTMPKGRLDSINNLKLDPGFNYYMLAKDMLYGMRDELVQSPKFDSVIISKNSDFRAIKSTREPNWNDIIRICRNDSCDALLLVDSFVLKDSLSIIPFEESCFVEYHIKINLQYSLYYPRQLEILYRHSDSHLLKYSEVGNDCNMALNQLPEGGDLIVQLFYETGQKAVDGIAPVWQDDIVRVYYASNNKLLRQGAWHARRESWIEAAEYWRKAVDLKNKTVSAKAALNMALVCELQNLPEVALEWIEMSDSIKTTNLSKQYRKIIETRLKHYRYLDKQMGTE
ncbi:MAG: DUF6340 family protein [Bacteroidales bacterium]